MTFTLGLTLRAAPRTLSRLIWSISFSRYCGQLSEPFAAALVGLAPLAFARPLRWAYGALSVLFVLDLWFPYAHFNSLAHVETLAGEPWLRWIDGGYSQDAWQKKVWSLAVVAVAVLLVRQAIRWVDPVRSRGLGLR